MKRIKACANLEDGELVVLLGFNDGGSEVFFITKRDMYNGRH